jgi:hypothetical protein
MKPAVEISPAKDGDGYCLQFEAFTRWFAQEHHAIGYAQDMHPDLDIVLFGPEGGIRRRYTPGKSDQGERTDSSVVTPPPRVLPQPEEEV